MNWNRFFGILVFVCLTFQVYGQDKDPNIEAYIEKYKWWAMQEQQRTGVPAAIKLAQGIHETGAGTSELAVNAKNHFGIKCRGNQWSGGQYTYTDDRPNECFRSYESEEASFKDHSDFLRNNKRYQSLFTLDHKDYNAWCHGLKTCGYATNPKYAALLIKYIEEYDLNQFTLLALDSTNFSTAILQEKNKKTNVTTKKSGYGFMGNAPAETKKQDIEYYELTHKNGLKGFYAKAGDLLLESAIKQRIRYNRLLQLNDLNDEPLDVDMFIYMEPKHKTGQGVPIHKVGAGEQLIHISQNYGIQLRSLLKFNNLNEDATLKVGQSIYLTENAASETEVVKKETKTEQVEKAIVKEEPLVEKKQEVSNKIEKVETSKKEEYVSTSRRDFNKPSTELTKVNAVEEKALEKAEISKKPEAKKDEVYVKKEDIKKDKKSSNSKVSEFGYPESEEKQVVLIEEEEEVYDVIDLNDENLSPLDRLKAHMDQNVYPDRKKKKVTSTAASPSTNVKIADDVVETRPAGQSPRPTSTTEASGTQYYTVQRGDTAYGISKRFGISINQLSDWNQLKGNLNVQVGQKLKVSP